MLYLQESVLCGILYPWKVVVVNLVGEGVLGLDQHIFEQTGLCWRDVCEPAVRDFSSSFLDLGHFNVNGSPTHLILLVVK